MTQRIKKAMNKKQKDRHLDVPAEANRDKHINFVAEERNERDPSEEPSTGALSSETVGRHKVKQKKSGKSKDQ